MVSMNSSEYRMRRSVLFVPASNLKALSKISSLPADVVIIDLEDAVAPKQKRPARQNMRGFFSECGAGGPELVIRINELNGSWGRDDLDAAYAGAADAVLLPKVNVPTDIKAPRQGMDALGVNSRAIWAMIETARGLLNLSMIAELGLAGSTRLRCLVAGTNDIAKEAGVLATPDRRRLTTGCGTSCSRLVPEGSTPSTASVTIFASWTPLPTNAPRAARWGLTARRSSILYGSRSRTKGSHLAMPKSRLPKRLSRRSPNRAISPKVSSQ